MEVATGSKDGKEGEKDESNNEMEVCYALTAVRGSFPRSAIRVLVWGVGEERVLDESVIGSIVERWADEYSWEEPAGCERSMTTTDQYPIKASGFGSWVSLVAFCASSRFFHQLRCVR